MTFENYIKTLAYLYNMSMVEIINVVATSFSIEEYLERLDKLLDEKILTTEIDLDYSYNI